MSGDDLRRYNRGIAYLAGFPGSDRARDLIRVALVTDETATPLNVAATTDVTNIGGEPQSAVDVAARIDALVAALTSNGGDALRVSSPTPLDVSDAEVDVDLTTQTATPLTITDDGSLVVASLPEPLDVSDSEVSVDLTTQSVTPLTVAVPGSVAVDSLPEPLDVSDAEVDVDLNTQTLGAVTVTDDGSLVLDAANQSTLPVEQQSPVALEDDSGAVIDASNPLATEQQSPVGIEDSTGTQTDPAIATAYLDYQNTGYDLVASGDLVVGPGPVERGTAVVIAASSVDNNAFSVSVQWKDGSGNVFQSESAADIGLDNVTEDYARLVRKAPQVELTITDESGAAQNNINIHTDTER